MCEAREGVAETDQGQWFDILAITSCVSHHQSRPTAGHFNLTKVRSICNHVADNLRGEEPKTTRLQRQLGMWNSYTKQPCWGRERNRVNLAISTGEGGKRPHAQVLIFDKRSKIIAQCKPVQDRMSAVLSFGAGLQTRPGRRWSLTAFFGTSPARSSRQWETKRPACVRAIRVQKQQLLCLEKD